MSGVTKLGLALILVFVFFLVALAAELAYVLWYRRRSPRVAAPGADDRELAATSFDGDLGARPKSKELLLYLLCWKNQSRIEPTAAAVSPIHSAAAVAPGLPRQGSPTSTAKPPPPPTSSSSEAFEAEMAKWRGLCASRVLFTIREEDKEGAESEGGSTRFVAGVVHVSCEQSADGQLEKAVVLDVQAAAAAAAAAAHEEEVDDEDEEKHVVVEDPASQFTPFSTPCASPPFYTPSPSPPRGLEAGADIQVPPDSDWTDVEAFSPAEDINLSPRDHPPECKDKCALLLPSVRPLQASSLDS